MSKNKEEGHFPHSYSKIITHTTKKCLLFKCKLFYVINNYIYISKLLRIKKKKKKHETQIKPTRKLSYSSHSLTKNKK